MINMSERRLAPTRSDSLTHTHGMRIQTDESGLVFIQRYRQPRSTAICRSGGTSGRGRAAFRVQRRLDLGSKPRIRSIAVYRPRTWTRRDERSKRTTRTTTIGFASPSNASRFPNPAAGVLDREEERERERGRGRGREKRGRD